MDPSGGVQYFRLPNFRCKRRVRSPLAALYLFVVCQITAIDRQTSFHGIVENEVEKGSLVGSFVACTYVK